MDVFATIIATNAQVAAARTTAANFPDCAGMFTRPISAIGTTAPTVGYVSSGYVPQALLTALSGTCAITSGPHDPMTAIANAGCQLTT